MGVAEDEKLGHAIILDKTVFHPQGGGQPSDHGTLIVARVAMQIDVLTTVVPSYCCDYNLEHYTVVILVLLLLCACRHRSFYSAHPVHPNSLLIAMLSS